jgi:threonine dehydratase
VSFSLVTLEEIQAAAGRLRGVARRTPVLDLDLSDRRGIASGPPSLALKLENLQPMGAFKIRGACNMIAQLSPEARAAGVITYSSGNHGQAVALVAHRFGIPAVIVMPSTAPRVKVDGVRRYGAEVIVAGTTLLDRRTRAVAEAAERGLTMVPPFDHPWIIAGQGTIALELLEQHPHVTSVFVPIGGGGLISGIATAVGEMRGTVRIIGVEPRGAAKMTASRNAGQPVTLPSTASIADGLLALRPGDLTFAHVQRYVHDIVIVDDEAIARGVQWLFREARIVAEPSGAAAVAAALQAGDTAGANPVAIVSGGNVEPAAFADYIGT